MIKSLSGGQMRAADEYTIRTLGVPSLTLMERAGRAIADEAEKAFAALGVKEALVVCGGGNNGGDGFVAARILQERGADVQVLCLAEKFSPDCAAVKEKYRGEILGRTPRRRYPVMIDCIFGTGLSRPAAGKELSLIRFINASGAFVISADIPSGLNSDNGVPVGDCVRADVTVAIGEYKHGMLLGDGGEYCGAAVRADIGIDTARAEAAYLAEDRDIAAFFPERKRNTHKGSYGKVSIIAGSKAYSGAALLAAMSALRAGAGYTELCVPAGLFPVYAGKVPEAILTSFRGEDAFVYHEKDLEKVLKSQCIVLGMGTGVSPEIYKMIKFLLANYAGRLVLDADALNALAKYGVSALREKKCEVLLTPHVKEFSRLSGLSVQEILEGGVAAPQKFAAEYGVSVLLKNAVSVLCGGGKTYFNVRGSACQAKGGSGDVLSGVIGSIAAQGHGMTGAALAGSYLCGVAGELCEKELGQYSVTAGDVIAHLSRAVLRITENAYEDGGEYQNASADDIIQREKGK